MVKKIINWKIFFILLAVCVISAMMVIPYSLALTSAETVITPLMIFASIIQNSILFALAIFGGLFFAQRIGLGLPILQGLLEGKNQSKELRSILLPSISLGVAAGFLIVGLSIPFNKLVPELGSVDMTIPAWKALLASFYGGIAEEVLLRLFLVSLFAWITFKIKKTQDSRPTGFGMWLSIILASVVFGLGHLPATAQITALTGNVIIRAIALNGVAGIVFGWLYWKKGLESAMLSHFSADIILHILTPFIASKIS